jgi:hypothetical protein
MAIRQLAARCTSPPLLQELTDDVVRAKPYLTPLDELVSILMPMHVLGAGGMPNFYPSHPLTFGQVPRHSRRTICRHG